MFVVRLVQMAAVVLVAGAFAFRLFVLPASGSRDGHASGTELDRWLRRSVAWGLLFALVSWAFWLALVSMEMSGGAFSLDVAGTVLSRTTFGRLWIFRAILLLLLAMQLFYSRAPSSRLAIVGASLAAALLMSLAWAGHAVGTPPPFRALHLAADAAHLLGAGLWLGALVPLLLVWHASTRDMPGWRSQAVLATQRFSALGVMAVMALAVTGFINACFLVGSFAALIDTEYGRLVTLKVALFVVIVALAAVNRFRLRPRLSAADPRSTFVALRRNALVELCLGVAIVAVVASLGLTPPSAHGHQHMEDHTHHHPANP
jgi:putative copper resistance protein D